MSTPAPILFQYDGEAMVPASQAWARRADKAFVVGEVYSLAVHEERSGPSHRGYFAALNEAFKNLPEDIAERYPTVEHLRKRALIKAGFYNERSIVCSSEAEAQRLTAFVGGMDEYAVVVAKENVVKVFTAKSQSVRAMPKDEFQESKQKVLDAVASLVGVTPEALNANAGRAA
jgi:hypothetical protein